MAGPLGLIDSVRRRVAAWVWSDEPPESFLRSRGSIGHGPTLSGQTVTEQTSLRVTAVLSCVKVLSESISTLPLMVFERREGGDKRPAPDHPLTELIHTLANEETTAQTLRETAAAHVLLQGTAYIRIVRDGGGDVRELWPLPAGCVAPFRERADGPLLYRVNEPRAPEYTLQRDDVWRIPGLSWGGVTGLSPIGQAREAVGLAMALERSSASALGKGARLSGILSFPGGLTDEQFAEVKGSWDEAYAGVEQAGATAVVPHGGKFEKVAMTFEDMQFLELKKFQVAEIARLFRVPLHMLYDDKAQPRANMEQASLEFVVYTLRPWLVRFEQTIARDLLLPNERRRYFAEHNVAGLLRGDFATRMAGYAQGRQWGWLSVNDIRRLENMNAIPEGDEYLRPGNMEIAGTPPGAGAPASAAQAAGG